MLIPKSFQSFSARIALLVSGLLIVTLVSTFILVNRENANNAFQSVVTDLATTEETFTSLLEARTTSLFDVVRPATSDHAFRTTVIDGHIPTLESAMRNLLGRIRYVPTDLMLLASLNLDPIATIAPDFIASNDIPIEWLTDKAFESEEYESSGIVSTNEAPYQLIASPLLIPDPQGWIIIGFPISEQFVQSTKAITQTDVSVVIYEEDWRISATTLSVDQQNDFVEHLRTMLDPNQTSIETELDGTPYLTRLRRLGSGTETRVYVALHGNLNQALAPYERLNRSLYMIFGGGLIISAFGALTLARSVSAPVQALTKGVQSIRSGDLSLRVQTTSSDELGQLGLAFNEMAEGLQDKERVRNLLGKVVSEEIAQELLKNKIELGGEEKELTVLFCDIRNFTQLCESKPPKEVLSGLNGFFSEAAKVIEEEHGVIDKYMGDAVMALFGAPVKHGEEENRAVASALQLRANLKDSIQNQPENSIAAGIEFGIGIASGSAVVGNMGSENRLNYSVIGDSVNTCARLESLTKYYKVPILVNKAVRDNASRFEFRWIDRIRAKGKQDVIDIYQPLDGTDSLANSEIMALHAEASRAYLNADWGQAENCFSQLSNRLPEEQLFRLYLSRILNYSSNPPDNWDGVFTHTEK